MTSLPRNELPTYATKTATFRLAIVSVLPVVCDAAEDGGIEAHTASCAAD